MTPGYRARLSQEAKAGKIEYRLDKTNIIHCPIGKVSFGTEKLQENFDTLMGAIVKAKPAAAKGQYIRSCAVTATMGPGYQAEQRQVRRIKAARFTKRQGAFRHLVLRTRARDAHAFRAEVYGTLKGRCWRFFSCASPGAALPAKEAACLCRFKGGQDMQAVKRY